MGEFGCTVDFISFEGSKCISTTAKVKDSDKYNVEHDNPDEQSEF